MNIDISPEAVKTWTPEINRYFSGIGMPSMRPADGGMWVSISDYTALSSALTQSQAETAAAYGLAVDFLMDQAHSRSRTGWFSDIRTLTPADAKAALDRMLADARADGMREAAGICATQSVSFASQEYAAGQPLSSFAERFACDECRFAILAAIPQGDAAND